MHPFKVAYRVEVRFRDCDLLGHVNNAVYFTYLEQARFTYWAHIEPRSASGLTGDVQPGRREYRFILVHVSCNFRAQPTFGDLVEVRIRVSRLGRSSFTFVYELVDVHSGHPVADAESVQVMYDYDAQRSIPIPPDIRTKIESFEGVPLAAE
jgi:acyl-CoA thioester hydrolase